MPTVQRSSLDRQNIGFPVLLNIRGKSSQLILTLPCISKTHMVCQENTHVLSNFLDIHSRLIQEAIFIRNSNHTLSNDTGS